MRRNVLFLPLKKHLSACIVLAAVLICSPPTSAQNVAITDDEEHNADATAILDVYSLSKGLLVPRVALVSADDPISGTKPEGLLIWNSSTSGSYPDPGYYYWSGSDWVKFNRLGELTAGSGLSGGTFNGLSDVTFSHEDLSSQSSVDYSNGTVIQDLSIGSLGHVTGIGSYNLDNRYYTESEVDALLPSGSPWDRNGTSGLLFPVNLSDNVGIGTDNPESRLEVKGNKSGSDVNDEPLFEVKRNDGQTVFAVYPQGVRVFVDEEAGASKGVKGGFAVGGFNTSLKGLTNDYLWITPDSVRVYVDNEPGSKGIKGGFAVGGFGAYKGGENNMFHINRDNYFIGQQSGTYTTPDEPSPGDGKYNSFFGYQSGYSNTSGSRNLFMGYQSGYYNTTGDYNVFIGNHAGKWKNTAISNVIIGYYSYPEYHNYGGDANVMLGNEAGKFNEDNGNVIIGDNAGRDSQGGANIIIGNQAGLNNNGTSNVMMGYMTGLNNVGDYNTLLGFQAGLSNNGSNNVFLGSEAGENATGSNKLYIENTNSDSPLIYGEFDNDLLVFNANNVGIGTGSPDNLLHVESSILASTTPTIDKHIALIENSYSSNARSAVLALKIGYADGDPTIYSNFITFFEGNDAAVGSIQGDNSGGITLNSGSADYAEYLPCLDMGESFEAGDIVGVHGGRITKNTSGAELLMAVSSTPIVLGNDPGKEHKHLYEKVGFVGIVPVKVRGKVHAGDYILASGRHDGTGTAVRPARIKPEQFGQVVGIAWESSPGPGIKKIRTSVGLNIWASLSRKQTEMINKLEKKLDRMEEIERELEEIKATLEQLNKAQ